MTEQKYSIEFLRDFESLKNSIGGVQKSGKNPHFKSSYIALPALIDVISDKIADSNFVTYVQNSIVLNGVGYLKTTLYHNNGEYIDGLLELITTRKDPQMLGSSLTYMRRYGLTTLLSIKEKDDDGNSGSGREKSVKKVEKSVKKVEKSIIPTEEAKKMLESCKDLKALQSVFLGFDNITKTNQEVVTLKNYMKKELTPKN